MDCDSRSHLLPYHSDAHESAGHVPRTVRNRGSGVVTLEAFSSALSPCRTFTTAEAAASRITADAAACAANSGADRVLGICNRHTNGQQLSHGARRHVPAQQRSGT